MNNWLTTHTTNRKHDVGKLSWAYLGVAGPSKCEVILSMEQSIKNHMLSHIHWPKVKVSSNFPR